MVFIITCKKMEKRRVSLCFLASKGNEASNGAFAYSVDTGVIPKDAVSGSPKRVKMILVGFKLPHYDPKLCYVKINSFKASGLIDANYTFVVPTTNTFMESNGLQWAVETMSTRVEITIECADGKPYERKDWELHVVFEEC